MTARWAVIGLVMACATPRPEKLENPVRHDAPFGSRANPWPAPFADDQRHPDNEQVFAARPVIDAMRWLPDPHEELRWPLGLNMHPVLEPTYPIAAALAEPGVAWTELCSLGAQSRHSSGTNQELVRYLRGWCRVADHDADGALEQLEPLLGSVTARMPDAIRHDVANLLADHGGADDAERLLARHHITDETTLDLLAATYVEVGTIDDATEINNLALRSDRSPDAAVCQRLTRRLLLGAPQTATLDRLVAVAANADRRCVELAAIMTCWITPSLKTCGGFLGASTPDPKTRQLVELYLGWPSDRVPANHWWLVTYEAMKLLPLRGADALALTALEAALRGTSCFPDSGIGIARTYAAEIQQASHDPSLDPRIADLIVNAGNHCIP